jgi:membrane-associated phospholipid phosphatase
VRRAALFIALAVWNQTAAGGVIPDALEQFRQDLKALVTVDEPPSELTIALSVAAVGVVAVNDAALAEAGQEHLPAWLDHFEAGGSTSAPNYIGVPMLVGGWLLGSHRAVVGGATLLEGNVLLDLAVNGLKSVFGRARPNRPNAGEWRSGGDSFPSSHAAHAFFIAAVLDATIDEPTMRYVLYSLASGVALARVHQGVHYPTDVVAGGLLGWWIGHRLSVAHHLVDRPEKVHLSFAPTRGGGMMVLSLSLS